MHIHAHFHGTCMCMHILVKISLEPTGFNEIPLFFRTFEVKYSGY